MQDDNAIEDRRQLAERYERELRELIDDGELNAVAAQKILDDLCEPSRAREPRIVRRQIWRAHVEDLARRS